MSDIDWKNLGVTDDKDVIDNIDWNKLNESTIIARDGEQGWGTALKTGLVGAAGNAAGLFERVLSAEAKPAYVSDEDWAQQQSPIHKWVQDKAQELEDSNRVQFEPWSGKSIAQGVAGIVPYAATLAPAAAVAMRSGNANALRSAGIGLASKAGLGAKGIEFAGEAAPAIGIGALGSFPEARMEGQGAYEDAIAEGKSPDEAMQIKNAVTAWNVALLTGTNSAELLTTFGSLKSFLPKNTVTRIAARLAGTGISEGIEEGAQEIIPQHVNGENIDWDRVGQATVIGGLGGMVLGGAGMAANHLLDRQADASIDGDDFNTSAVQGENKAVRPMPVADGIEDTELSNTNPELVNGVNELNAWVYDNFGKDLVVSGGARSKERNASVNGAENSHHLYGTAIDVDASNLTEEELSAVRAKAKEMGFNADGEDMYHDKGTGYHMHLNLSDGVHVGVLENGGVAKAENIDVMRQFLNDNQYLHDADTNNAIEQALESNDQAEMAELYSRLAAEQKNNEKGTNTGAANEKADTDDFEAPKNIQVEQEESIPLLQTNFGNLVNKVRAGQGEKPAFVKNDKIIAAQSVLAKKLSQNSKMINLARKAFAGDKKSSQIFKSLRPDAQEVLTRLVNGNNRPAGHDVIELPAVDVQQQVEAVRNNEAEQIEKNDLPQQVTPVAENISPIAGLAAEPAPVAVKPANAIAKKGKAEARYTAKGEKLIPQTAELRGDEITVISKPSPKTMDHELYTYGRLPSGNYTLKVDEIKNAIKSHGNPNWALFKLIQKKYSEAFANTGEKADALTTSDPLNSRIIDNQISAIKQALAAYDVKQNKLAEKHVESKLLLGKDGKPLTVYHGSFYLGDNDFEPAFSGQNTGGGEGGAIFFTDNKNIAEFFAYETKPGNSNMTNIRTGNKGKVRSVNLLLSNPLDYGNITEKDAENITKISPTPITVEDVMNFTKFDDKQMIKTFLPNDLSRLKEVGYDGIMGPIDVIEVNGGKLENIRGIEYGVFSADQIVSVKEEAAQSRFDGKRAETALDSLIGRKPKSNVEGQDSKKKFVDVFNESELDAELARAKAEMSKLSANPFFNPALMKSLVKIGGIYIQKGVNSFANWSVRMAEALGNDVKPFLKAAWNTLQAYPEGVKFNDDVMTAVMEYVGSRVDDGRSLADIRREFADQYGGEYLDYVDSAHRGIMEYPTEIESRHEVADTADTADEAGGDTVDPDTERQTESAAADTERSQKSNVGPQAIFNENQALNGLEISFKAKPGAEVIDGLKAAGYRWSMKKKLWYAKKSNKAVAFAESIGYEPAKVVELVHEEVSGKAGADYVGDRRGLQRVSEGERTEGVQGTEESKQAGRGSDEGDRERKTVLQRNSGNAGSTESVAKNGRRVGDIQTSTDVGSPGEGTDKRLPVSERLRPAQKKTAKARETPGHNFQITDADNIGKGGLKTKYRDNVAAIRLLKELESENRLATPEEQKILARYVGWGGLAPVFNIYDRSGDSEWNNERVELKELLSKEEYESARRSTLNAHYTAPGVVKGIWDIVQRLGFKGGRILEPSMGVGNFFGLMPRSVMNKSSLSGIELDGLTGRLAKQLYQKANIEITGFEKAAIPDNFYDLIISNVPFGDFKLHDPAYNKYHYNIHNYFFAKAFDKVRPGGLIVFITGSGTMQSGKDSELLRNMLNNKADMLGAVRLPNTTFKENAGTEVTTDLIVLRKREEGAAAAKEHKPWLEKRPSGLKAQYTDGDLMINEYYQKHPEMLIGELAEDKLYRGRLALDGKNLDVMEELQSRISKFPKNIYKPLAGKVQDTMSSLQTFLAPAGVRERSYILDDKGVAYQNIGKEMVAVPTGEQKKTIAFAKVKQALKNILAAQIDPVTQESNLLPLRKELNALYDSFVKDFGYLNDKKNVSKLGDDPEYGLVSAIEEYKVDKKTKKVTANKRDIFEKRTVAAVKNIETADSPIDALATSLAQRGELDLDYMAGLLGKDKSEVIKSLEGLIYENPITRDFETAEEYLSGNVREKLEAAVEAAKSDPKYDKNVEELKKVQPEDLKPEDINANLGVPWIPESDIEAFADKLLDEFGSLSVKFNAPMGTWLVDWQRSAAKNSVANRRTWGTPDRSFKDILDYALNQKTPIVYDTFEDGTKVVNQKKTAAVQEKLQKVKDEFRKWIWSDESRTERLLNYYNNNLNNWRLREYDGSHLTLPGYSLTAPQLREHQKNAIWRVLQNGNTLLAHSVGTGKTWTMQTAGMEARRLGIAKKPMYVIPNHMVKQFENEFRVIYPNANLLTVSSEELPDINVVAGKGLSKKEIEKRRAAKNGSRQKMLSRIAMEDWDGIIISHNMFKRIPMSPEAYKNFYRQQVDEISEAILAMKLDEGKAYNKIVKELEKQKEKLEERLKRDTSEETKDIVIPFEQLGIDQLFVDEADLFKNLAFSTKMTRIAGINNTGSQRSMDMFVKTQYLTKLNNGRGVVFATGTPISNTMAEMFTMNRYMDMDTLREKNMQYFDSWAASFANVGSTIERSPDGIGYRQINKVTSFINAPEMIKMFRKFADVVNSDKLNLDIPKLKNDKPTIVEVATNDALADFIKNTVKERAMAIKNGAVDPKDDNMLKLTTDLRKASLDMRLVDGSVSASEAQGKIQAVAENAFEKYKESDATKGTQLIFCDLSTPKGTSDKVVETDSEVSVDGEEDSSNVVVYDEVKRMLMRKGIPSEEIAFMHDAKTKDQKQRLFDDVIAGNVRILIGSTEKMGAGTNVQKKLVALHHVDAPWRPRDIEQREGRILRQGNENKEVEIFTYVTKDSFDANMWEKLKNKANIISQAMSDNLSNRVIEDMDAVVVNFAEVEALASGNPLMAEKTMVDAEVNKYSLLHASYTQQRQANERRALALPSKIDVARADLKAAQEDVKSRQDVKGENFVMELSGKRYTERAAAGEALGKLMDSYTNKSGSVVGKIGGFDLRIKARDTVTFKTGEDGAKEKVYTAVDATVVGKGQYTAQTASLQGIEYALMNGPDNAVRFLQEDIVRAEKELKALQVELEKPFEYQEKYEGLVKRQAEINKELKLDELMNGGGVEESIDIKGDERQKPEREFSIRSKEGGELLTPEEVLSQAKRSIPNGKNFALNGATVSLDLPNGRNLTINLVNEIVATPQQLAKASAEHEKPVTSSRQLQGSLRTVGLDGIIELAKDSKGGTIDHEVMEFALQVALTEKQKRDLEAKYKNKEAQCDAYRDWQKLNKQGKGTVFGKLWRLVQDFADQVKALFGSVEATQRIIDRKAEQVFEDVASGEVWNRDSGSRTDGQTNYAVNADVNPDAMVNIVDLTGRVPKEVVNSTVLKRYVQYLAKTNIKFDSADNKAIMSVLPKDIKHIVYSSMKTSKGFLNVRSNSLFSIGDLLNNAVLIESIPNKKNDKKPNVRAYHRFYVPVKLNDKIYTVRLVAEEQGGEITLNPTNTNLYDVIIEKNRLTHQGMPKGLSLLGAVDGSLSTVSIRDMLSGVNDYEGRPYFSAVAKSDDVSYSIRTATENLAENLSGLGGKKQADERIEVKGAKQSKAQQFGILEGIVRSPGWIAEKYPQFKAFFKMGDKAMQTQENVRGDFDRAMKRIYSTLKSDAEQQVWSNLLLQGDIEGKEYSRDELRQQGISDEVAQAYARTRSTIRKAYTLLNDARKQVRTYQKNMSGDKLRELRKDKFVEILKVEDAGDHNYLVAYKMPKVWTKRMTVDAEFVNALKEQSTVQIVSDDLLENGSHAVTWRERMGDLTNRGGYIPHFFHDYFIMRKNEDGSNTVVGSGRTVKEAMKKAEAYLEKQSDAEIVIAPKSFSFGDDEKLYAAVVGDTEYQAVLDRVMSDLEMSVTEAREFLQGKVKTRGRHRWFGNFKQRKGVEGFETDMNWLLKHYFNATGRYVALEEFKPAAIGLFERYFGAFDKDYSDNPLAHYTKQYINDMNGNPSALETQINNLLNRSNWYRKHVASNFGERAALQMANSITGKVSVLKLGFLNISSALLNLSQLINTVGLLGEFTPVAAGMKNALINPSMTYRKIYKETGIMNDITLDTTSGYGKFRPGNVAAKTMYLFRTVDMFARKATVLAAYHNGRSKGMNHDQAINYAKEINRKANFDYGVADAPNIFRRGSIFSQIALQFKKYPIKELELMHELITKGSAAQNAKFWGTYFLLCGLLQIPMSDWLDDIWKELFGSSPKTKIKKMVMEAAGDDPVGKELAKIAMYGIGSVSPLNVDVSSRAGVGDVTLSAENGISGVLGGATLSTAQQLAKAVSSGDTLASIKALSPALGNYMQAVMGHTEGRRARKNSELDTMYDQILKATGFRNVDESIAGDMQGIIASERSARTNARQKVMDSVIAKQTDGEKLSAEDIAELKRLGVTGKQLRDERNKKRMEAKDRMQSGLSKRERAEHREMLKFLK